MAAEVYAGREPYEPRTIKDASERLAAVAAAAPGGIDSRASGKVRRPDPFSISHAIPQPDKTAEEQAAEVVALRLKENWRWGDLHAFAWGDREESRRRLPAAYPFYRAVVAELERLREDSPNMD